MNIVSGILKQADNIKSVLRNLSENGTPRYWIHALFLPYDGEGDKLAAKGFKKDDGDKFLPVFEKRLDDLVHRDDVARISVVIADGAGRDKQTYTIILQEAYRDMPPIIQKTVHQAEMVQAQPQPQTQPTQQQTAFGGLGDMLALLGFGNCGLNGASSPQDGLAAVLDVRDQRMQERHEREKAEERMRTLAAERDELKNEVATLKGTVQDRDRRIEELEGRVDDLTDENEDLNEEIERLKPENTVLGMSISELGSTLLSKGIRKAVRSNAGLVGRLMGVDKQTMLGMLDADENETGQADTQSAETAATPLPDVEPVGEAVEVEPDDEVAAFLKTFGSYLRGLDTDGRFKWSKIVQVATQGPEALGEIYDYATSL